MKSAHVLGGAKEQCVFVECSRNWHQPTGIGPKLDGEWPKPVAVVHHQPVIFPSVMFIFYINSRNQPLACLSRLQSPNLLNNFFQYMYIHLIQKDSLDTGKVFKNSKHAPITICCCDIDRSVHTSVDVCNEPACSS